MDALNIIGAHGVREDKDFYPTPSEATVAILDFLESKMLLRKTDRIWECACGNNAMVDVMRERGYTVIGTDVTTGQDYLTTSIDSDYEWIITNPPFNLSRQFIERSVANGKPFAMLLKSQYWHSAKRRKLFTDHPPMYVLPLTWRPDFSGKGNSMMDVMWCVWIGDTKCTFYQPLEKPRYKDA